MFKTRFARTLGVAAIAVLVFSLASVGLVLATQSNPLDSVFRGVDPAQVSPGAVPFSKASTAGPDSQRRFNLGMGDVQLSPSARAQLDDPKNNNMVLEMEKQPDGKFGVVKIYPGRSGVATP
jgi:hypothetical protein